MDNNELKREEILEQLKGMLGKTVTVFVDRPFGSVHPKHKNIVYGVNYGYIKELVALDGEYQDAYILGEDRPLETYQGKVIAILSRLDDNEDKLIVANRFFSDEQIMSAVEFQEKYFKSVLIK